MSSEAYGSNWGKTHQDIYLFCWSLNSYVSSSTTGQKLWPIALLLASIPSMFFANLSWNPVHTINVNVVIKFNSETIFIKVQHFFKIGFSVVVEIVWITLKESVIRLLAICPVPPTLLRALTESYHMQRFCNILMSVKLPLLIQFWLYKLVSSLRSGLLFQWGPNYRCDSTSSILQYCAGADFSKTQRSTCAPMGKIQINARKKSEYFCY